MKVGKRKDQLKTNQEGSSVLLVGLLERWQVGIKKVPRRKRTFTVSGPIRATISPISSEETRSGGLSIGIGSAVFR